MDTFWKGIAGILIAGVLTMAVGKQQQDVALILTMAVCAMASIAAFSFLEPVISFLYKLEELGDLQAGVLTVLLKMTGIGLVSELAAMICRDSGNASLAQAVKSLGMAVMLSLTIPILETFLDLIQSILGEL